MRDLFTDETTYRQSIADNPGDPAPRGVYADRLDDEGHHVEAEQWRNTAKVAEPMTLRWYQEEAKQAFWEHLRNRSDNPCIVLPTGAGKSPLMAAICLEAVSLWNGRILVLAHVKELLTQTADKLARFGVPCGVYSAGLKKRDQREPVIVAGIQSIYKKLFTFDQAFDLILVDEAHLIKPDGEGMYGKLIADAKKMNPNVRIGGLTATPYRLGDGMICGPTHILNEVCYEVGVKELIARGHLCRLRSKGGSQAAVADLSQVHVRGGEYIAEELEAAMCDDAVVKAAVGEILAHTKDRLAVIIFTSGRDHAAMVREEFARQGVETAYVDGESGDGDRAAALDGIKTGKVKYLVNISVATTGFDAPNIDCVVLLRATLSPGLYYQMVGRGLRTFNGKPDCLVLDFGGNTRTHGPVDAIRVRARRGESEGPPPAKECPNCHEIVHAAYTVCPECEFVFPPTKKARHNTTAEAVGVLSGETSDVVHEVMEVSYYAYTKKNALPGTPRTLRVQYKLPGYHRYANEWVCIEHAEGSFARRKAVEWWVKRSRFPMPDNVDEAVEIGQVGGFAKCSKITVRTVTGEDYPRIIDWELGPIPDPNGGRIDGKEEVVEAELDEIPF